MAVTVAVTVCTAFETQITFWRRMQIRSHVKFLSLVKHAYVASF